MIHNRLKEIRDQRGTGAAELARQVGVRRQTIYAIEARTYIPNTTIALKLAQALQVNVEDLFHLESQIKPEDQVIRASLLYEASASASPVRLARVGRSTLALPVMPQPQLVPWADGLLRGTPSGRGITQVTVLGNAADWEKRVVLAGCDPAISVLQKEVERRAGQEVLLAVCSSRQALEWLREGRVHVAGSHLRDPDTGEFNLPWVRRLFPKKDTVVVTFAKWEEGIVVRPGNPKRVKRVEDLSRKDVKFVNRDAGSGSRLLLDTRLAAIGIEARRVHGYAREVASHLEAAQLVLAGEVDCCLATRLAARVFGLDFIPLESERFDLITLQSHLQLPGVQALFESLNRAALRRQLEVLAGYDTTQTGTVLAS
jgi:molybdopterin molybdotransferase/putative molybdopterin biosynthesis protein